ncbi:hypothetical protein ACFX2A_034766 [Malus domestica]
MHICLLPDEKFCTIFVVFGCAIINNFLASSTAWSWSRVSSFGGFKLGGLELRPTLRQRAPIAAMGERAEKMRVAAGKGKMKLVRENM